MRDGLLSSFAWTFAGKLGQQGSTFIVSALITRALGTAGRGTFAEAQTWVAMAIALFGLSLDTAIYHFANRERYPVPDGMRVAIALATSTVAALFAGGSMAAVAVLRPDRISNEAAVQMPLMFAALVVTILATNLVSLAQALARVRLAAAIAVLQGIVNLAVVGVAFLTNAIDLSLALWAVVATQGCGALAVLYGFARTDRVSFEGVTWPLLKSFVGAGLKQHIGVVAAFLYLRFNTLIVLHYCGADETGLLATAWTLAFGLFAMLGSFQLALYPRVLHSADDFTITVRSLRLGLYVGFCSIVPLLISARWLLRLYGGASFEAATPTFRLMTLAAWVTFLASLVAPYLVKSGALLVSSGIGILVGVASVGANVVLVPLWKAAGAGVATLLSVLVSFALSVALFGVIAKRSPLSFLRPSFGPEKEVLQRLLAGRRLRRPVLRP